MQAIEEGKTVFLVEGEKDADKLRGYGVIASTAPESLKWHEDFTAILKNADVVFSTTWTKQVLKDENYFVKAFMEK